MRRIFRNEFDHFSAESREEATRLAAELYDYAPEDVEQFEEQPLPDEQLLTVTFQDGCGAQEGGGAYPTWVDDDADAQLEWLPQSAHAVKHGWPRVARITAPARVWAKHVHGMVCSTEY